MTLMNPGSQPRQVGVGASPHSRAHSVPCTPTGSAPARVASTWCPGLSSWVLIPTLPPLAMVWSWEGHLTSGSPRFLLCKSGKSTNNLTHRILRSQRCALGEGPVNSKTLDKMRPLSSCWGWRAPKECVQRETEIMRVLRKGLAPWSGASLPEQRERDWRWISVSLQFGPADPQSKLGMIPSLEPGANLATFPT